MWNQNHKYYARRRRAHHWDLLVTYVFDLASIRGEYGPYLADHKNQSGSSCFEPPRPSFWFSGLRRWLQLDWWVGITVPRPPQPLELLVDCNAVFEGGDDSLSGALPLMGSAVSCWSLLDWLDVLAIRLLTERSF